MTRKGKTIFLGTEFESEICEKAMMLDFLAHKWHTPKFQIAVPDGDSNVSVTFNTVSDAVVCLNFIKKNT